MRKRHEKWVMGGLIAVMLVLVFATPSYGWRLRDWFTPASPWAPSGADATNLAAENEALKAQLAILGNVAAEIPLVPPADIRAMVYSRYPLNFKSEFLVGAGSNEGVAVGKAVIFQGLFIGTVQKVFSDSALVQTIFDSQFKMPVRIGSKGYDGLLTGGAYPAASSIQKGAHVAPSDIIYTAGEGAPYGLPIGIVASTSTSPDNLFLSAPLNVVYDVNSIQTVLIAR